MDLYSDFKFGEPPKDRPYIVIDMVATIDGKTVSGDTSEAVTDLGSDVDHRVMRRLQDLADGVLIGAGTLRATPTGWDPGARFRLVISGSGDIDLSHSFFAGTEEAYVVTGEKSRFKASYGVREMPFPNGLDPKVLLSNLRAKGCERLLILGGSRTNGLFLHADLVDELFLTVAPKIKLGEGLPTIANGDPLPRAGMLAFDLIQHQAVGSELFLRYRRAQGR